MIELIITDNGFIVEHTYFAEEDLGGVQVLKRKCYTFLENSYLDKQKIELIKEILNEKIHGSTKRESDGSYVGF